MTGSTSGCLPRLRLHSARLHCLDVRATSTPPITACAQPPSTIVMAASGSSTPSEGSGNTPSPLLLPPSHRIIPSTVSIPARSTTSLSTSFNNAIYHYYYPVFPWPRTSHMSTFGCHALDPAPLFLIT